MKYLPYEQIENINHQLSCIDTGDVRVFGRLECYSCKQTREDVKLKNRIDTKYDSSTEETVLSPKSPFGPLSHTTSKKTFLYLLGTLNAVYPDYDFGDISPELFSKMPSISLVVHRVANAMLVHFGSSRVSVEESIWSAIDQVINTKVCDVYSFSPPTELEPDNEEGNLWSFFYFFYNKPDKRIVFFTARGVSLLAPLQSEEMGETFDEEIPSAGNNEHQTLSYEQFTMDALEL